MCNVITVNLKSLPGVWTHMCGVASPLGYGGVWGEQAFEAGQVWVQILLLALANCMILSKLS